MNALRLYQNAYKRIPLIIHAVETGLIMTSADVLSQIFVERKPVQSVDFERSLRFGGIGICYVAPMRVAWYKILEKKIPGSSAKSLLQKVALDQLCFAPPFVLVLVSLVSYANGMNSEQVLTKLKNSYTDIMLNNLKVWPCVQLCNFYLVPPHMRMTTVQIVSLMWNIYLSWKTNLNKDE
ncbi:Protein Mpv17 [Frankliniella fusca]|uniref:Mitochondrial inner membrane protein Mpv17 n=1 Tax=Frankliniella fusca TaxID=407009 RepID=A0AAE1HQ45_9NEOP|nr:Protein Mpv17 [Frankliniella fusca]